VFGIGWTELIVIVLILLVVVGPKQLPHLLRKAGSIMAELRAASRELSNQISIEVEDLESPAELVRGIGRDALESVNAEYEDVRKADAELRRELDQLADPYAPAAPEAALPAAPAATDQDQDRNEDEDEDGASG
jgi:sec-independent protein translocase protein TatB